MASLQAWWMLLLVAWVVYANPYFPIQERRKCVHTKVHKLLAADCHGINLPIVPQTLNTGIEILDLSYNRIRTLYSNDFSNYPYVQYLYLGDNLISYIENNTFSNLHYLEVVNMSLNAIHVIPHELFHLTTLRKLTMDFNIISEESLDELQFLPIMPSLNYLSLAHCRLKELPSLRVFPHIEFLNVSGNFLTSITAQQLAPACLLKFVDVSDNEELYNMSPCTCAGLKAWSALRQIEVQPSLQDVCTILQQDMIHACTSNVTLRDTDNLYSTCKEMYKDLQQQAVWNQVGLFLIFGSIAFLVALSFIVAYCRLCHTTNANLGVQPRNGPAR